MKKGTRLHCPCRRFLGYVPFVAVWTGSVERVPHDLPGVLPDGLAYLHCSKCKKWQRFEVVPPNPAVELNIGQASAA